MKTAIFFLLVAGFAFLTSCARPPAGPLIYHDLVISEDTQWQGEVIIDGRVEVLRGATLTLLPGTDISFRYLDQDRDGLGDGTLVVKGGLQALGTAERPIRFHSANERPQPGDWLEIAVDFSSGVHLRFCEIRDSAYTLHAHFTSGLVEDCHIHHNIDGCRIGQARFTFRNNLVEQNSGKGINFRNSRLNIHDNLIRDNAAGIFLFENDQAFTITQNNLTDNRHNLRLGDFYFNDVSLRGNWWGTTEPKAISRSIYDHSVDPEIGQVSVEPAKEPIVGAGPRTPFTLRPAWDFTTGGFVDAAPQVASGVALYPSWDGNLYALHADGSLAWKTELGDVIDAAPALTADKVFVQTWKRQVMALRMSDGQQLWSFSYPDSPADDHRQGGLLIAENQLLVPAWNGTLYALEPESGELLWKYSAKGALRASPSRGGERIYLADNAGWLTCLSLRGGLLWEQKLDAAGLTAPQMVDFGVLQLSKSGTLTLFDLSGNLLWQKPLAEECYYAAPVVEHGVIYLATTAARVYALSLETGETLWRQSTAGAVYATPTVQGGRLLVGDNAGHLFAFSCADGTLLTEKVLEQPIQSRPLIWNQLLLIGSRDQQIHAYQLDF